MQRVVLLAVNLTIHPDEEEPGHRLSPPPGHRLSPPPFLLTSCSDSSAASYYCFVNTISIFYLNEVVALVYHFLNCLIHFLSVWHLTFKTVTSQEQMQSLRSGHLVPTWGWPPLSPLLATFLALNQCSQPLLLYGFPYPLPPAGVNFSFRRTILYLIISRFFSTIDWKGPIYFSISPNEIPKQPENCFLIHYLKSISRINGIKRINE